MTIKDFKIQTTTGGHGLLVAQNAVVFVSNINWGACAVYHNFSNQHGIIIFTASYTISGSAVAHHASQNGSFTQVAGVTVT